MSSYGDGNNYRGTSCKDSEVTTYKMPWPESEEVERLKQHIGELTQECERLRERLDAELYGFPCKALKQSDD